MSEEITYDENGNLQIPTENIVQNLSMKLANKELENTQLQIAVEMLSKELQKLKSYQDVPMAVEKEVV